MTLDLHKAKRLVRDRALGVSGIHAVGMKRANDAVTVHVESAAMSPALRAELERLVAPHRLEVVISEPARIT